MKILYIGPQMLNPRNGGDRIEMRNQQLLERYSNGQVDYFSPDFRYTMTAKLRLGIGVTGSKKKELRQMIVANEYDIIYVSQSLYGVYAKLVKSLCSVPIITFFHNAEIDFFACFHDKRKLKGLYYILKVLRSEYLCIKKSDRIIAMNERDSLKLQNYYKRGADLILPTSFKDDYKQPHHATPQDIDYLFLGSCFPANTDGIQWFIDKVMPHIPGTLYIIGNNMDTYSFEHLSDRIHIKGFVEDVAEYYHRAKVVISPIFSGSGMKTKTAEALMYGKTIVGTQEAFEGYIVNPDCMKLCNTAEEFIKALQHTSAVNMDEKTPAARSHFLKYYSDESVYQSLADFLKKSRTFLIR